MTSKPPPIPPSNLSPKGSGERKEADQDQTRGNTKRRKSGEQGQSANTKQNTRHQGYQQDR
jgi:hypothetical protein